MSLKLSGQEVNELKDLGYNEYEIQQALKEIEEEDLSQSYNQVNQNRGYDARKSSQMSAFASRSDDNIVKWQLELNDILERAEHILKGDVPKFDNGFVVWKPNPKPENNPINEYGVQEIMKILAMYVNRNTILSDYNNTEINIKVYDAGREINNLFFMRYDDFGMDTEEKKKNYPIIVREIIDIIHSAYKRALFGAEKKSLREMISIQQSTQTQGLLPQGQSINQQGVPLKERSLLNPMRFIRGKYV